MPFPVNLERMNAQNTLKNDFNCYNSEVFPAFLWRFPVKNTNQPQPLGTKAKPRIQISPMIAKIFASGRLVFCGFKSLSELIDLHDSGIKFSRLETILHQCFEYRIDAPEVRRMIGEYSFDYTGRIKD